MFHSMTLHRFPNLRWYIFFPKAEVDRIYEVQHIAFTWLGAWFFKGGPICENGGGLDGTKVGRVLSLKTLEFFRESVSSWENIFENLWANRNHGIHEKISPSNRGWLMFWK